MNIAAIVLYIIFALLLMVAKSAIHEILAALIFLSATMFLCAAQVVQSINNIGSEE